MLPGAVHPAGVHAGDAVLASPALERQRSDPAALEVGGSWRSAETAIVLGAWAVVGLVLAPTVLRRMARRESGSRVAERRERTLQRIG